MTHMPGDPPARELALTPTDEARILDARGQRFDALVERFYPPEHLTFDREVDTLGHYALVERSAYDSSEYAITSYESMEDASHEHGGQEYPEDWPAIELVDLDTGERFYCIPRLDFEPFPEQAS